MSRPSRQQTFMEVALVIAKRATCMRLSVGAIITKNNRIVSCGWNGVPKGEPHCRGNDCPGKYSCKLTIHAELNALSHLPDGVTGPLDLYVTDSPCSQCYQDILGDGRVSRIFFSTAYRVTHHLDTIPLWSAPEVYRITPSGYIMDWRTKEVVELPG